MKISSSLANFKTESIKSKPSTGINFKEAVKNLEMTWLNVQNKTDKILNVLPSQVKPLVEAQLVINDLSLKSQMITRAGEAVASTMRRIQQFGS